MMCDFGYMVSWVRETAVEPREQLLHDGLVFGLEEAPKMDFLIGTKS